MLLRVHQGLMTVEDLASLVFASAWGPWENLERRGHEAWDKPHAGTANIGKP